MKKHFFFLGACLFIAGIAVSCNKKGELVSSSCPDDLVRKTPQNEISVGYFYPGFSSNCPNGVPDTKLTKGLPSGALFPQGVTEVEYTAVDDCGNEAVCAFKVIVQKADYCDNLLDNTKIMHRITGLYTGSCKCGGVQTTVTKKVCLHPSQQDHLLIDDDAVTIDSTCTCQPNPSIPNYRIYSAKFRNDSLFLYTDTGTLGNPNVCVYKLKKE